MSAPLISQSSPLSPLTNSEKELVSLAVKNGARLYFNDRRRRVIPFVEKHFSLKGALQINSKALGKDMIRAPANLLWAMPYLSIHVSSLLMRKAGITSMGEILAKVPPGFRTQVQNEVEWLIRTELFELPYQDKDRSFEDDAILSSILAQPEISTLVVDYLGKINHLAENPQFQSQLAQQFAKYTDTRMAAADLACGVLTLSGGIAFFKQLTPGAMSTGSILAAAIAKQSAIAHFVLGPTMGSIYYSIVPATASLGLLAASTGGVLAALGVVSAFSGVVTDPLQKQFGIHERRLLKLIDSLEDQFLNESQKDYYPKDHYVARIFDFFDLLKTASMNFK